MSGVTHAACIYLGAQTGTPVLRHMIFLSFRMLLQLQLLPMWSLSNSIAWTSIQHGSWVPRECSRGQCTSVCPASAFIIFASVPLAKKKSQGQCRGRLHKWVHWGPSSIVYHNLKALVPLLSSLGSIILCQEHNCETMWAKDSLSQQKQPCNWSIGLS